MHLIYLFALAACYYSCLTNAASASCSQTATSNIPQLSDVASLVINQASNECAQLQTVTESPLVTVLQGCALQTNAATGSIDIELCQNVLSDIAQQCIQDGDFSGSLITSSYPVYNLTETLFPGNVIQSGPAASRPSITAAAVSSSTQAEAGILTLKAASNRGAGAHTLMVSSPIASPPQIGAATISQSQPDLGTTGSPGQTATGVDSAGSSASILNGGVVPPIPVASASVKGLASPSTSSLSGALFLLQLDTTPTALV